MLTLMAAEYKYRGLRGQNSDGLQNGDASPGQKEGVYNELLIKGPNP